MRRHLHQMAVDIERQRALEGAKYQAATPTARQR
jgi:hypothetical protein